MSMAPKTLSFFFCIIFFLEDFSSPLANAQLAYNYYDQSCPTLQKIVKTGVYLALTNETRMAASLLRLHFHDCFVNGCDGSVLLDDTPDFKGEKNALHNIRSIRGFDVIDRIKANVERDCPSTVSCADILALAAREAVLLAGGPFWTVPLGRRDGLKASQKAADERLPSPIEPLHSLLSKFASIGLDKRDLVALSGAHTIGVAQCFTVKRRLFDFNGSGKPDPTMEISLLSTLQKACPNLESSNGLTVALDGATTSQFDNFYYKNLMNNSGVLDSDQALMGDPETAEMVKSYSFNPFLYSKDFAAAMVKLGNIGVLTGKAGQIRTKCGSVNR